MSADTLSASSFSQLAWCKNRAEAAEKGHLKTLEWLERQSAFQDAVNSFRGTKYFKGIEASEKQRFPFELAKIVAMQLCFYQMPSGKRPKKKSSIYTRTDHNAPLRDFITRLALTFKQKYGGFHRQAIICLCSYISDSDCERTVDRVLKKVKSHGGDIKQQTVTMGEHEFTLDEFRILTLAVLGYLMEKPRRGYTSNEWQNLPLIQIYREVTFVPLPTNPKPAKN
jgi:hypothetical protein